MCKMDLSMKHFSLLGLMFFVSMVMLGQTTKDVTVKFSMDDFILKNGYGEYSIIPKRYPYIYIDDETQPALPYICLDIEISEEEEFLNVSYEECESVVFRNIDIVHNKKITPIALCDNYYQISNQVGGKKNIKENIQYTGTHITNKEKHLSFVICPFRYDELNKILYLREEINLVIKTSLSEQKELKKEANRTLFLPDTYKYVIITTNNLKTAFQKLALWKSIKGVKSKVLTIEQIDSTYSGKSLQHKIKNALYNYYLNGMEYALLGGDINIVPARICKSPFITSDTNDMPVDLYYSCFDNDFEWDANGNGIYGEESDNVDLAPNIILTRASLSNDSEAETFVDRIISYERNPLTDNWSNSILMCGAQIRDYDQYYNGILPMPSQSDAQIYSEMMYDNVIHPIWPYGARFRLYDTYSDHPYGADYEYSKDHLRIELEKGYTFVDIMNHAWTTRWGWLENWWSFDNTDAMSLNNRSYSIITTFSCYSNAFDKPEICMSEAFLRNPNSGILAYVGLSREGWFPTLYTISNQLYHCLLSNKDKQFGRAIYDTQNAIAGLLATSSYLKGMHMSLNPMGDPEMSIYTSEPLHFTNVELDFSNGILNVSTAVDSCRICVSSALDGGTNNYEVANNCNNYSFSGIEDDCIVCVSKPGYIPFVARIGNSVVLQKENIDYDLSVFADTVNIGKNVTTDRLEGVVEISKGKTTINFNNSVIIKNGFLLKKGAMLDVAPIN